MDVNEHIIDIYTKSLSELYYILSTLCNTIYSSTM